MMNVQARHFTYGMDVMLGPLRMVSGSAAETNGAVVIGLIVAAVSFGAWQRWRKA